MRFTVKLFAYFRDNRFRAEVREYPEGTTVEEVIRSLGIDLEEVGVTMINSRHCTLDQVPAEGDQLAIFPAIVGAPITLPAIPRARLAGLSTSPAS